MSDTVTGPEGAGIKKMHVDAADAWHISPNNPQFDMLFAAWLWVSYEIPGHTIYDTKYPVFINPRSKDWTFGDDDAFKGTPGHSWTIHFTGSYATYHPGESVPVQSNRSFHTINDSSTSHTTTIQYYGYNPQHTADLTLEITWDKPFKT